MSTFKNDNTNIYYEDYGNGKPLILVAGLASDSQSWATVIPELSNHFRLILPDNRGCGRTKCSPDEITITGMADDVIALMDHLQIENADLLGHSMGGYIAQQLCLKHPDRFHRLILASTSAYTNNRNQALLNDFVNYREEGMELIEWFRCFFFWIFTRQFFNDPKTVAESLKFSVEYPYLQSLGQFQKQVEAINGFDVSKKLTEIMHETLIISGKEDILYNPFDSFQTLSGITNSSAIIIQNAAHAVYIENSKDFEKHVVEFLTSTKD